MSAKRIPPGEPGPAARRERLEARLAGAERVVLDAIGPLPPDAVVLGSGLGPLGDRVEDAAVLAVSEIPGHPVPRVQGHAGRWVKGTLGGSPVLALQGRAHFYEGHSMEDVTFATALLARMGVRRLVVTNASGSANPSLRPGDLMLITGVINLFLHQPRWDASTPRAGLMDPVLLAAAERAAARAGVPIQRGVLAPSYGPSYETPAEIRMVQRFGGDAACMSTVPEILAAGQLGLRVVGFACITNLGSGLSATPLDHNEVEDTARRVSEKFQRLITEVLGLFHREDP